MMLYPPMKDLLKQVPSRYMLVNVVAQRAREISTEAQEGGYALFEKPVTIAVREVAEGKINIEDLLKAD
jgi:DNA-directed RNA polymerase subunit omega